jgi:hypothetical protein
MSQRYTSKVWLGRSVVTDTGRLCAYEGTKEVTRRVCQIHCCLSNYATWPAIFLHFNAVSRPIEYFSEVMRKWNAGNPQNERPAYIF